MSRESFLAKHRAEVAQTQIDLAHAAINNTKGLPADVVESAKDHLPNFERDLRAARSAK